MRSVLERVTITLRKSHALSASIAHVSAITSIFCAKRDRHSRWLSSFAWVAFVVAATSGSPVSANSGKSVERFIPTLIDPTTAVAVGASANDAQLMIVVFSDPMCPYCRVNKQKVDGLLNQRDDVRVIYRENPMLNSLAGYTAIAQVVSERLDKAREMRAALLTVHRDVDMAEVIRIAEELEVEMPTFLDLFESDEVRKRAKQRFPEHYFSSDSARAIFASPDEGSARKLRDALYNTQPPLSRELVVDVIRGELPGSLEVVLSRMYSDEVESILESNRELVRSLGVVGTPYYVLVVGNRAVEPILATRRSRYGTVGPSSPGWSASCRGCT